MIFLSCKKENNNGYTLVELIVVIAIMAVLTGGVGIGVGLAFSKDADQCATRLNDAIYKTRIDSMSRKGTYELTIDNTGNVNKAIISCSGVTPSVDDTEILLDNKDNGLKTNVTAKYFTEGNPSGTELVLPVTFSFDKSKGCVDNIDGIADLDNGILVFEITAVRGSKESKVQVVTSTGKHTIGEF